MTYGIKKSILDLSKGSYATDNHLPEDLSNFIDCSSGINPLGFSKQVNISIKNIPLEIINSYPESNKDIKNAIIKFWENIVSLNQNQILLGGGSIELIYKINKLFIDGNSKVLGYSPQFTDYIDDINSYGAKYEYYLMDMNNNFKFDPNLFLEKMNTDYQLYYLDNPNNPTGQIIHITSIEKIIKRAKELGVAIIIDEAYGDFMDLQNSAVSLIHKYDNLLVIRTFAKGLGLAGLRAGYIVTSNEFSKHYLKISNPYEMNSLARYLTIAAIEDRNFIKESIDQLINYKERFMNSLSKFIVLETSPAVPIMTIKHPDPNVDLEKFLLKHGIITVSGRGFIGLGKDFVRARLTQNVDQLINAFQKAEAEI